MNYSNQYHDSISTVQLTPFAEGQWNRIVTYAPIYVHWTDLVMMSEKPTQKPRSAKRTLVNSMDINSINLDDEGLLNELQNIRTAASMPRLAALQRKSAYHEAKFLEEDHNRRTTSPTDEYHRLSDFFHQTRESSKPRCSLAESSFSNQQDSLKRPPLPPQTNNTGPLKALPNINFGPKPEASLSVQLRQSTIARERALATSIDHRNTSPITMSSSRRPVGSAHSARLTYQQQQQRISKSQTPQTIDTSALGGLYERVTTDSSSSIKKSYPRSTNTSRTTVHMLKTKNDRARKKQNIELKTILVPPGQQPTFGDTDLEQAIPNSIEIMRKIGGSLTAFERNLRSNYHRKLNQFRNGATKG